MNEPIIQIRGIGKKYNITHAKGGYVALRDVLTSIAKSPFRFFKQKAKEATGLAKAEEFWALKDVSLDIQKGDIVGIIGSNGAGKSTLLKILTGITPPTEGEIRMNGRVASLLEVGTGFHPELTGRENIFLNGAILGMTKKEIASKFDEIVAFAGIEKFLDTPVKRYSSGMYVRLAFSVAAHMDPDILLVDEVLAVGDAEFQKKCLGKMEEVTRTAGRTILFVSHNMEAVRRICSKAIFLDRGEVRKMGSVEEVLGEYLRLGPGVPQVDLPLRPLAKMQITKVKIMNSLGAVSNQVRVGETFSLEIDLVIRQICHLPQLAVSCTTMEGVPVFFTSDCFAPHGLATIENVGSYRFCFDFPKGQSILLNEGDYYLYIQPETNAFDGYGDRVQLHLSVVAADTLPIARDRSKEKRNGPMAVIGSWSIIT